MKTSRFHVDMDDLVHAGVLGLFDAASKFNPDKQVAFSSYAKHRIKGAILDSLRQLDWALARYAPPSQAGGSSDARLASTLQRNPTESEVAQKLGMDQDRWRTMMLDLRNVGLISASTRANENDDLPAPDFPCKPETHPDSHLRARATTRRFGRGDEDPAGEIPEGCLALLHGRNDHERDRRHSGHQRKPRVADPQGGAREDADRAPVERHQ